MPGYDLTPKLRNLSTPTLVIAGDHDFIPAEIVERMAHALPNVQLVTIQDCGHFAYLECASEVRRAFNDFRQRSERT
jgi:pimeloyl-ACP methyl ester carboxylesterase